MVKLYHMHCRGAVSSGLARLPPTGGDVWRGAARNGVTTFKQWLEARLQPSTLQARGQVHIQEVSGSNASRTAVEKPECPCVRQACSAPPIQQGAGNYQHDVAVASWHWGLGLLTPDMQS